MCVCAHVWLANYHGPFMALHSWADQFDPCPMHCHSIAGVAWPRLSPGPFCPHPRGSPRTRPGPPPSLLRNPIIETKGYRGVQYSSLRLKYMNFLSSFLTCDTHTHTDTQTHRRTQTQTQTQTERQTHTHTIPYQLIHNLTDPPLTCPCTLGDPLDGARGLRGT